MEFQHRYFGESKVSHGADGDSLSFAPDTLRPPVFFSGDLNRHLPFREAMSALHDVVVADLRTLPRERPEYFEWLKENETSLLAQFMLQQKELTARAKDLETELNTLRARKTELLQPFYKARTRYFDHIYKTDFSRWVVLDPVITVHPDAILFECFSRDESSYGVLSCCHNVFDARGEFACGTTNVDYSAGLYDEFQKIRSYRRTHLAIEPAGFSVQHNDDPGFVEHKIDVPDSWVRGFLQVSSAMVQPGVRVQLHPMDLYNICQVLRRRKERVGPRSLRFELNPGRPVQIVCEPWGQVLDCPRSTHDATGAQTIRIWGRRRLLTLERLIPAADSVEVHLLGTGLPSFWMVRMPDMVFTLGLSGWSANDWSRNAQFDLLSSREHIDSAARTRIYETLCQQWHMKTADIARASNLDHPVALSGLQLLTQAGRVMYDLAQDTWRLRELTREPLPVERLRFSNEREESASALVAGDAVGQFRHEANEGTRTLSAQVKDSNHTYSVSMVLDADERILSARCNCAYHFRNQLRRGPCEHLVALRLVDHQRRTLARAASNAATTK